MDVCSRKTNCYAPWILPVGTILAVTPLLARSVGPYWGWSFHVTLWQLLILSSVGLGTLWLNLRGRIVHLSLVAFPILFLVGYPLRVVSVETSQSMEALGSVSLSFGRFMFSSGEYWEFTAISVLGILGLTIGQLMMRPWCRRKTRKVGTSVVHGAAACSWAAWWWFGLSIGDVVLSVGLGVGSSGLEHAALPFRLTGVLFFARTLVLPLWGMYLFGVAVENRLRGVTYRILLLSLLIGVVSFPVTLSKASLLYAMLPYLAYLTIYAYRWRVSRKMVRWSGLAVILLLPVTVLSVQAARDLAYSTGRLASLEEIIKESRADFGSLSVAESASTMQHLVLDRIIGSGELMGVVAGPAYDKKLILEILRGNGTKEEVGVSEVFYELFGLAPSTVSGVYNGKAFGLFGLLYLAHDPLFVFIVALILGSVVLWVEDLFLRNFNAGAAALVGFMISMAVWEGGFDTLQHYPLILGAIFVGRRFLSARRRRAAEVAGSAECLAE